MAQTLISYQNIDVYQDNTLILKDVCMDIAEGEFAYITGKVGSGKSSLLKTFYGELPASTCQHKGTAEQKSAVAHVLDYDLLQLRRRHLPDLRRGLGIIFQDFQLLTDRTVEENLRFVLRATGWKREADIQRRIDDVLILVEMSHKAQARPNELSGGEQQRIAIARAILNKPRLILADEPTGNLDAETSRRITQLLQGISQGGSAVVMITHNLALLDEFPGRVFRCKDQHLEEITAAAAIEEEITTEQKIQA